MPKVLVLVRHGKAQSRELAIPDFDRELTGAGKRSLKAWAPKSAKLLRAEKLSTFEMWASPSKRTVQTARVLGRAWGKKIDAIPRDPLPVMALWRQDSGAALDQLKQSQADCVIMVGHNPFIEDICALLTGSAISFSTGAVAAVLLGDELTPASARLLWFVQGPCSEDWK